MKKLIAILAITIAVMSCNNEKPKTSEELTKELAALGGTIKDTTKPTKTLYEKTDTMSVIFTYADSNHVVKLEDNGFAVVKGYVYQDSGKVKYEGQPQITTLLNRFSQPVKTVVQFLGMKQPEKNNPADSKGDNTK